MSDYHGFSVRLITSDLPRSNRFYGGLAAELGFKDYFPLSMSTIAIWAFPDETRFAVKLSETSLSCDPQDGIVFGFTVGSEEQVDRVYALALELGATECTPPDDQGAYYGAIFYDPDGHKIEIAYAI